MFQKVIGGLSGTAAGQSTVSGTLSGGTISGADAFSLHDTYGFPIDLTLEMAREQGLQVDEEGFRRLMAEQRQRAKTDAQERKTGHVDVGVYRALLDASGPTTFTGYVEVEAETTLRGMLVEGIAVDMAPEGSDVEITLDRSPFYAEAGGQLADHGVIRAGRAAPSSRCATRSARPGSATSSSTAAGSCPASSSSAAEAVATVDVGRRKAVSRAHTATHLVHRAIRRALGEQAAQAGSLNDAGRFRFDFSSPTAVPASVLADVEAEVNTILLDDLPVRAFVTTQDEARRLGAIALFNEKYGEAVRVVEVGEYARELCGGTHAARSAQLGLVKLLGESSIASGVRRIEGLVGADAFGYLAREHLLVNQLTEAMKARPEELLERVQTVVTRVRELEKELERVRAAGVLERAARARRRRAGGVRRRGRDAPRARRHPRRRPAQARARRAWAARRGAAGGGRGRRGRRRPAGRRHRRQRPGARVGPRRG